MPRLRVRGIFLQVSVNPPPPEKHPKGPWLRTVPTVTGSRQISRHGRVSRHRPAGAGGPKLGFLIFFLTQTSSRSPDPLSPKKSQPHPFGFCPLFSKSRPWALSRFSPFRALERRSGNRRETSKSAQEFTVAGVEGMRAPGLNSARPGGSAATVTIVTVTISHPRHRHRHRKAWVAVRWGCPCPDAATQKGCPHPGALSPPWGFVPNLMPPTWVNVPTLTVGAGDAVPSLMPPARTLSPSALPIQGDCPHLHATS